MGEVYRARDTKLNRDVAIKVLVAGFAEDAARLARFRREAQVLASLHHPNIAAIFGLEESSGVVALALELVEGEELAERLKRGAVPVGEAIAIAKQIAEGLEAAHEKGIVHRDLKPANVKLAKDGAVKILDFGLAKAYEGEPGTDGALSQSPTMSPEMTGPGIILGTAAYMSPEQARGKPVDKRADIWAFGVLLFEMLAGRRLFRGESVSDTLAEVLREEIPWPAIPEETPAGVRRLLRRCLVREPRERLRDIGEARIALGSPDDGALPGDVPRRSSFARWVPWLLAAAALFVAVWTARGPRSPETRGLDVQQFELAFPADMEPRADLPNGFALAPNGQQVAMIGVKNGVRSLFVRSLGSKEVLEIAASSGVNGVTFSPDGTQLVLQGSNQVTTLSLGDRQRTVLVRASGAAGPLAWGESGVVFPRDGALWIAPTGGGEPRALTALDEARHEILHTAPIFLPGGNIVLFSSLTTEAGTERIEAVSVEGGARSVVVERATTPIWSPTGHLLFARDRAVLAIAFDEEAVQVRGVATTVLPPGLVATTQSGTLALRLSANGTLLFVPGDLGAQRLVSVARDGSALTLELPRGRHEFPRLSPDGRRLMVASDYSHLVVLNLDRGTRSQFTNVLTGAAHCIWNRDGSRIVYRRFNVPFWISADGSDRQGGIEGTVSSDFPSAPGPDPDSVLVTRLQPETSFDVFLLSLSSAFEPRPLVSTRAYEGGAQLSPDGRWLGYVSNETGRFEIYLRPFPELDRQWQVSEGGGTHLRWSANGRAIYFRSGSNLMEVLFEGNAAEPAMGKPMALFRDEYDMGSVTTNANYDVTADGRFLMLRREPGSGHLRIVLNWTEELKRALAQDRR
jgi:serine/threonine-protein kinase